MKQEFYPLLVVPAVPHGAGIRFLHPKEQYDIDEFADVIWSILGQCNGYNVDEQIVKYVIKEHEDVDKETVAAIIEDLTKLGIILDSRNAYVHSHQLGINPMFYSCNVSFEEIRNYTNSARMPIAAGVSIPLAHGSSAFTDLQAKRRSCRSFSDKKVIRGQIAHVLTASYSIGRHSTPSAGGLYPLKIYLVVTRDQPGLLAGYYEYDPEKDALICYNKHVDRDLLQFAFDSETLLFNAPAISIIAGDLNRHGGKYSNRGYRYTLLEAGHVAQNMHLAANEVGLATLEYGGFLDNVLAEELGMDTPGIAPLISIAVGNSTEQVIPSAMEVLEDLEAELVGSTKPVRYVRMTNGGRPDKGETFFGAAALYKPSPNQDARRSYKQRFAGGTATSSGLAQVKALAEAYERYASSLVRVDHVGKANDFKTSWLDPFVVAPLSDKQYDRLDFLQPFDRDTSWQWVQGKSMVDGSPIWVPVDLVFYPLTNETFGRKLCFEASSSGVAAYTSRQEANRRALLELIERDSVMRNWFMRTSPSRIVYSRLPFHWQRRVKYWQELGRDVFVLDMSQYGVVTINVMIMSEDQFPCFVNGCASSEISFDEAVAKAFHEAELGLMQALKHGPHRAIDPRSVVHPMDHAKLYALPDHLDNLRWLCQGKETDFAPEPSATIQSLFERFNAVSVRLSPDDAPLHVVRVLSDRLIPISFGYSTEHYLHHTLDVSDVHPDAMSLPHYFA
ncbi:MAG TPA: YcaO-like family protein [Candidatus Saccharimonadales bacterium]|nr:YcaO-like family protein [Candidatus Saccharimonadales bacterium]